MQAYEWVKAAVVADQAESSTSHFEEFGAFLKPIASDSNAGALDSGLEAVLAFLDAYEGEICPETGPGNANFQSSLGLSLCSAVIDKALGSTKASSVAKGKAVLMKLVELTNDPAGTTAGVSYVATICTKLLSDKRPKVPPHLLEVLVDCLAAFGCAPNKANSGAGGTSSYTSVLLKECIATVFPTVLINASSSKYNKPTKDMCTNLVIAVCRYMSYGSCTATSIPIPAPIQATIVGAMKPAQKADFDKLLAAAASAPQASVMGEPTLFLKKDRAAAVAKATSQAASITGGASGASTRAGVGAANSDDMREFLSEVDLLKKLKAGLSDFNSKIGDIAPSVTGKSAPTKWSSQLEGLNMIIGFIGPAPKCRPLADYTEAAESALVTSIFKDKILDTLKHFLSAHNAASTHITLQVHCIKIYMLLADAYRAEFTTYARQSLSNLLQKYKDKKLVGYVSACLLAYLRYCPAFTLADVLDDLKELVGSKKSPPHCIIGIMELLSIVMQELVRSDMRVLKPEHYKAVHSDLLLPRCEDSDVKIREAATSAMLLFAQLIKEKKADSTSATPKETKLTEAAYKTLTACQTSHPKLYKKVDALLASSAVYSVPKLTSAGLLPETAASASSNPAPVAAAPTTAASAAPGPAGAKRVGVKSKVATSASSAGPSATGAAPAKPKVSKAAPCDEENSVPAEVTMTIEDATSCLGLLGIPDWDSAVQELWGTGKWQDKQQVLTLIGEKLKEEQNANLGGFYSEALVAYLAHHSPKFKISNMNVLKAYVAVLTTCASYTSTSATGAGEGSVATTSEALTSMSVDDEAPVAAGAGTTPSYKPFSRTAAWTVIRYLIVDKMADKKYQASCTELLTALSESICPLFVIRRVASMLISEARVAEEGTSGPAIIVSPAAHQCFLDWCKTVVGEFGVSRLAVQSGGGPNALASVNSIVKSLVVQVIVPETDHKQVGVRSAAIELAGALYAQMGPRLLALGVIGDDMKPQVKSLLETEFAKSSFDPAVLSKMVFVRRIKPPTLQSAADARATEASGAASGTPSKAVAAAPSSDEFPRIDVLSMLSAAGAAAASKDGAGAGPIVITSANVVAELNNVGDKTSWQNRKAAIEALVQACDKSGHYIEYGRASPLEPVLKGLRTRITSDTNSNLKPLAATALGVLVASMDVADAARCMRSYSDALLSGLSDNNKRLRENAINVLQVCCMQNPKLTTANPATADAVLHAQLVGTLIPAAVVDVLTTNNVGGRLELLNWCISVAPSIPTPATKASDPKDPFADLVLTLMKNCLQDKLGTVRSAAEQFLILLAQRGLISKSLVETTMRLELTPAIVRNTQAYTDKVLTAFSAPVAATGAQTAAANKPPPAVQKAANTTAAPPVPPATTAAPPKKSTAPAAAAPAAAIEADSGVCGGFRKSTNRARRCDEFVSQSAWPQPPEECTETEYQQVRSAWEPLLSAELAGLLFPSGAVLGGSAGNTNNLVSSTDICISAVDHMTTHLLSANAGAAESANCLATLSGHLDLLLRWCSLMLVTRGMLRESTGGTTKLLNFLIALVECVVTLNSQGTNKSGPLLLTEGEIVSIVPHLIDKSGHKSERHRVLYRQLLCAMGGIIKPVNKFTQLLVVGLGCKNKKSRIISLEVIQHILESITGSIPAALNRASIKEVGSHFDSKDTDLLGRSAGLELTYVMYHILYMHYHPGSVAVVYNNQVVHKLLKLLSSGVVPSLSAAATSHDNSLSERSSSMIDDRIKSKLKEGKPVQIVGSNLASDAAPAAAVPIKEKEPAPSQPSPGPVPTAMASRRSSSGKTNAASPSPMKQTAAKRTPPGSVVEEEEDKAFMSLMQTPAAKAKPRKASVPAQTPPEATGTGTWGDVASPEVAGISATPAIRRTPAAKANTSEAATPAALSLRSPAGALTSPAAAHPHAVLESVYVDIVTKVDEMLGSERAVDGGGLLYRQTSIEVVATDYIKLLHTIISNHDGSSGAASEDLMDGGSEGGAGGNSVLLRYIVPLVDRVLLCLERAFSNSPGCSTVDVNLTSICLATLFTVIKHRDLIAHVLSTGAESSYLYAILRCCLTKLVDARLLTAAGGASEPTEYYILHEYNVSIIRALNLILLKLSSTSGSAGVTELSTEGSGCSCELLVCLMRVLYNTSSAATVTSPADLVPDAVTKPTSRLVLKVLSEEVRSPAPFVAAAASADPYAPTLQLLNILHEVFNVHPPTASAGSGSTNDTAFCTAKTVAFQVIN